MNNDSLSETRKARIAVDRLKLGMYVCQLDRPWNESPFTVRGFTIQSEEHIRLLQELCAHVYIEIKRQPGRRVDGPRIQPSSQYGTSRPPADARAVYEETETLADALPRAKETHLKAKSTAHDLLESVRLGKSFSTEQAKEVVSACVDSVISNPKALHWLSLLKNVDEYTAEHSVNVCLLAIILGRTQGLHRDQLEELGLCGLLHDMGKARTPLEILNKEGALTEEEFAVMKSHTTMGYDLLRAREDVIPEAAEVAWSHHERLNGRGYPRALKAEDISYFSRIVAVVDTYDAITSNRCYSTARSAMEGLQILMGARGTHFDPDLVQHFVNCIGVYPAGSIAELSSGEIGIVLPVHDQPDKPKVLVVRDKRKNPCPERLVDLSKNPVDPTGRPTTIRNLLSDGIFGIELKQYHAFASKA